MLLLDKVFAQAGLKTESSFIRRTWRMTIDKARYREIMLGAITPKTESTREISRGVLAVQ